MYRLSIKNSIGDTLALSDNPNYTVYKIEGLNPPKATINSSVNTTQDGSVINSTRLENRNIVIYMTINNEVEVNRIALYNWFTPKREISLFFANDTRDVYIEGVVDNVECDFFTDQEIAQVSIICGKPYFKDIDVFTTAFSDITSSFEFPFSIPSDGIEISAIHNNIRKSILYTGDTETGVEIKLFAIGQVVNPILYDVLKRTFFKLNITLEESDTIEINTNVGEKAVTLIRDGQRYNALGYMVPNSTWFTLTSGDNVFTYSTDSGSSNLQITFTSTKLYGGV